MARPIIGGPDTPKRQVARATSGGVTSAKPLRYSPPQGPIGIMDKQIGIGGYNHGNKQQCYPEGGSGSPGLHGENKGLKGSQR